MGGSVRMSSLVLCAGPSGSESSDDPALIIGY